MDAILVLTGSPVASTTDSVTVLLGMPSRSLLEKTSLAKTVRGLSICPVNPNVCSGAGQLHFLAVIITNASILPKALPLVRQAQHPVVVARKQATTKHRA